MTSPRLVGKSDSRIAWTSTKQPSKTGPVKNGPTKAGRSKIDTLSSKKKKIRTIQKMQRVHLLEERAGMKLFTRRPTE